MLLDFDKCILRCILGSLSILQQAEAILVHAAFVERIHLGKCAGVMKLQASDQMDIGVLFRQLWPLSDRCAVLEVTQVLYVEDAQRRENLLRGGRTNHHHSLFGCSTLDIHRNQPTSWEYRTPND